MGKYLINLFLYTFAIYGVMIFFREIILLFNRYQNSCKIVLIINEENIEEIFRDISWSLKNNKSIENIYILNENETFEANDIIQRYCVDNDFFILADKDKIIKVINGETK